MGLSLMDLMLLEDDSSFCEFPTILDIFNKLDLLQENDQFLDDFAINLFRNISLHLRRNHFLKATIAFVKALSNLPMIGIVI